MTSFPSRRELTRPCARRARRWCDTRFVARSLIQLRSQTQSSPLGARPQRVSVVWDRPSRRLARRAARQPQGGGDSCGSPPLEEGQDTRGRNDRGPGRHSNARWSDSRARPGGVGCLGSTRGTTNSLLFAGNAMDSTAMSARPVSGVPGQRGSRRFPEDRLDEDAGLPEDRREGGDAHCSGPAGDEDDHHHGHASQQDCKDRPLVSAGRTARDGRELQYVPSGFA
jgi:hypothetical protein